ncbi:hypothetical protein AAMO2058_000092800 [Amorphochlora amoebiformis]
MASLTLLALFSVLTAAATVLFLCLGLLEGGIPSNRKGGTNFRAKSYLDSAIKCPKTVRISDRVTQALIRVVDRQVTSRLEHGLSVSVYYKGKQIASVCGGSYRSCASGNQWQKVTPRTRFMGYSVSKGIAATALLTLHDAGLLNYEDTVTKHWPEFGGDRGKDSITIQDAISHRAGLQDTPPLFMCGFVWEALRGRPGSAWRRGETLIERYRPDWIPGSFAKYHPVSFSWIAGGIAKRVDKRPINEVIRSRICEPLFISPQNLRIGEVPPVEDVHIASLEHKPYSSLRYNATPRWRCLLGILESIVFVSIGNLGTWRRICLPSSNAVWTPSAVARM